MHFAHRAMISLRNFDFPDGESLTPKEAELLGKLYACEDIVHDWDDSSPAGFKWWQPVFDVLAPPEDVS